MVTYQSEPLLFCGFFNVFPAEIFESFIISLSLHN